MGITAQQGGELEQAAQWWRRAAVQGRGFYCCLMQYSGEGMSVRLSASQKLCWCKAGRASSTNRVPVHYVICSLVRGIAESQHSLAVCLGNAQGVAQDMAEAKLWLQKAAAQGHAGARVKLEGFDAMMQSMQ